MASSQHRATICANGPTVSGVDVSKWQGNIDWGKVKGSGVEFAFIRVSDGLSSIDEKFHANWQGTKDAGLMRGAYQFFRPASDPIAQAKHFVDAVGHLEVGDLPPVIDIEVRGGVAPDLIVARAQQWIDYVEAELGMRPVVYTARYFWDGEMNNHDGLSSYDLWVPHWGPECPNLPDPWSTWAFFQTTDSGSVPGISGAVDLDVFNGSLADLAAFALQPDQPCLALPPQGGVVDDLDSCFEAGGKAEFIRTEKEGYAGSSKWTYATDFEAVSNYGLWRLDFQEAGTYRLEAHIPAAVGGSRQAVYQIGHGTSLDSVLVDQAASDGWIELGELDFAAGAGQWVRVDDNTGEDHDAQVKVVFDAIRLTPVVTKGDVPGPEVGPDGPGPDEGPAAGFDSVSSGCRVGASGGRVVWVLVGVLLMVLRPSRRRRR